MWAKIDVGLHVKCLLLFDCNKNWNVSRSLVQLPNIKLHDNPIRVARADTCGQTDMMELIGAFLKL